MVGVEAKGLRGQEARSSNGVIDLIEALGSRLSSFKFVLFGVVTRLLIFAKAVFRNGRSSEAHWPGEQPIVTHLAQGWRLGRVLALSVTLQGSGTFRDSLSDLRVLARVVTNHLGVDGVLGHKRRGGGGRHLPVDRIFACSGGRVLVRLLCGGPTKVAWFARDTLIAKTWEVIRDAMGQGARLLICPSGEEVGWDMTLGEMVVVGNQLTLELRWSGVGGGEKEDEDLFAAAKDGNKSGVATALSRGANVKAKNSFGNTPLSQAAYNGHVEVVQVLLAAGADLNAKDKWGWTPLIYAARYGRLEVVQVLLAAGADLNAKNYAGWTPLMCAAMHGHAEVVQVLLAAGANVNAKNDEGKTALDWAKEKGHTAIVAAMIEQQSEPLTKCAAQGGAAAGQ